MMRRYITRWLYRWLDRHPRRSLSAELSSRRAIVDNSQITEANRDDWREAARARAISKAEDAGLRGAERQKFILKRTKICYEELENLLGDA
jgi:hypothetical protein